MRDVARLADVSVATVSFTLNNTKPVAPATRERVEQAIRDLGFRRNEVARALASKRSRVLAVLYPALQHRFGGTVVHFFTSAARRASELGYNLILSPIDNDAGQLGDLTAGGLVDGVLLMEVQLDDPRVTSLLQTGTPFAIIGRTREPDLLTYVDIDFETTMAASIEYLSNLGHTRIALVTGSVGSSLLTDYGPVVRTEATYGAIMATRDGDAVMISCDETPAAGRDAASRLIEASPDLTAVIVMNEQAAFGLVSGFRNLGFRVPEDISVISMSSSAEMAAMSDPTLTLMAAPGVELGRMGVDALVDKLEGRAANGETQVLLPCVLVEGESTARVREGG
ncbi:LacI family DNA-binding transcriptional regulator [Marisediminicola senii]|uniref:LacI family DNA-binding transcriptional regulator n=1 Tax=Marisediminicola senii TaxID=2711233 RepID=UPI001F452DDA|nr:LacI family DNA-binding transcriptional regulator [Marisediminicola senii]